MRICKAPGGCHTPVFGTDKLTKIGYCRKHQSLRTDLDRRSSYEKAVQPAVKARNRTVGKVAVLTDHEVEVVGKNKVLNKWFKDIEKEIDKKPYCWNCDTFIPKEYYRHATAHIFPKSLFPSVSTHPLNYLILGSGCGCHHTFDKSVEAASKMRIWRTACARFEKFEELITENHKYYDSFKKYFMQ